MDSPVSEDRRIRRTRSALQQALLALMDAQPYEKIQIKGLTEKADVSRPVFYAHFASIDEVIASIIEDRLAEFRREMLQAADTAELDLHSLVHLFFKFWENRSDVLRKIFQCGNNRPLQSIWSEQIAQIMDSYARLPKSKIRKHKLDDYVVEFVAAGTLAMLRRWAETGMREPITDVSDLAYQLAEKYGNLREG